MMSATGMPSEHLPCRITLCIVFPQNPTVALMCPLTQRFYSPARRVAKFRLNFSGGLPAQELGVGKHIINGFHEVPLVVKIQSLRRSTRAGRLSVVEATEAYHPLHRQ